MKAALAFVALSTAVILTLAAGYGPYRLCQGLVELVGDKLEWRARSLAGPEGVNCGHVESGHDARDANDCVRKSLALGRAMRVRYEVHGIDSTGSTALVRSPVGHVYEIVLDGNPGHAGPTSLFRQRIAVKECSTELQIAPGGRLTCISDGRI